MENFEQQAPLKSNRGWPILLLAVLVGLITVVFPFALVIAPALWAYAGARTKPYWIALPAAAYGIAAFQIYSTEVAAGLTLAAVIAAVLIYWLLTKRESNTYVALTLSGVFLVGLYAAVCLPGILDGRGAFADAQNAVDSMIAAYRVALNQMTELDTQTVSIFSKALDAFSGQVPNMIVSALCIVAGVFGLGNLLFFRLFCRKRPEIVISPMRAFKDWTLPRSMVYGLFALLIASLAMEWAGWAFAEGFSNVVNVLVGMPLLLQGLSVVDFMIERTGKNVTVKRVLTYVAIGFLFGVAETPLILVGCFDQIFRFRDRLRGVPPRAAV